MVNMDPNKMPYNRRLNQDSEDSKILDSSRRQNDNSDTRHAGSIYMADG